MANSTRFSVCLWQTIRKLWFLPPSPRARARGERQHPGQLLVYSHSVLYTSNVDHRRGYVLPSVSFITLGVGQSEVFSVFISDPACCQSHTLAKGFLPFPVLESKESRPVAHGSNMPWEMVTGEERRFWKKNSSIEIPLLNVYMYVCMHTCMRVFADANIGNQV